MLRTSQQNIAKGPKRQMIHLQQAPQHPPEPVGIAQKLCQTLEDDIVTGLLVPGARLEETQLAKRFGVSRTPVREALQLLTATELAEKIPNRGVYVSLATPERLTEMFESMAELEAMCGRLAAKRMTSGERHALEDLHHELAHSMRVGDNAAYESQNREFHNAIYGGTHNDVLVEVTQSVRRRVAPFRRVQFNSLPRLASSHEEHQGIVDAILRGDHKAAEELLYAHIMSVHDVSQEYLATLRDNNERLAVSAGK